MTRYVHDDLGWDAGRYALWEGAVHRATNSKRGQKVLREIEAALLALPEKRLIDGTLSDGAAVCSVGALAAHRRVLAGETWGQAIDALAFATFEDDSVDETARYAERHLDMAFALAWDLAFDNDHNAEGFTPEARYECVLRWVRARLHAAEAHA